MLIIIIRTVGPTERSSSHDNERDENILQTNKENSRQKKKKKKINLRRAASELGNWYVVGQVLALSSRKSEKWETRRKWRQDTRCQLWHSSTHWKKLICQRPTFLLQNVDRLIKSLLHHHVCMQGLWRHAGMIWKCDSSHHVCMQVWGKMEGEKKKGLVSQEIGPLQNFRIWTGQCAVRTHSRPPSFSPSKIHMVVSSHSQMFLLPKQTQKQIFTEL